MTEKLIQQVRELFTHLRKIETLLNDINSKVDYIIEIYGLNKDIEKHNDIKDWTGGSQ